MRFSPQKHLTQDFLYLVPLSLFFLLFRLGDGSLSSAHEAVYAAVARGMLQSGDWLTGRLGGELWLEKPPLTFWFTAIFYALFGVSEFSSRLFSSLCGTGCVLATYWLGRRLFDRWTGFLGALVLLSSSDFIQHARLGGLDAPLALFFTLSLIFFWMGQGRNRHLIFSGVALGFAVMTKGFAAFLIFPVVLLYAMFANRLHVVGRSSYWVGVMLAAAIALPWHLAQLILHRAAADPTAFSWQALLIPLRFFDVPGTPWLYYVKALVNDFHPWILVATVSAPWFAFKALKDREEEFIFLSVWIFFLLGALTLFHPKEGRYLLPAYPALSLTVGYVLARVFRERSVNFIRAAFLIIMALHVPYSRIFEQDHSFAVKGLSEAVRAKVPAGEKVALLDYDGAGALFFYAERPGVFAQTPEELSAHLRNGVSYLIVKQEDTESLFKAGVLSKSRFSPTAESEELRFFAKKS